MTHGRMIIPLTPEDFSTLEKRIGINQDQFCQICDGPLETSSQGMFAAGIFYKCLHCGKTFKKTFYRNLGTQQDYFQLEEIEGVC